MQAQDIEQLKQTIKIKGNECNLLSTTQTNEVQSLTHSLKIKQDELRVMQASHQSLIYENQDLKRRLNYAQYPGTRTYK